ncbi:hypothetical protein F3Y22_tig00111648pilonHSYRG00284 [Hibiscus syriacus]|uniref:DNA (Cytosine-5)-methyltransferase DRM1/2 n=1 Tax=Hibiscus syriacus TaxID=106335 RepID=A0A6A2XJI0_HIBSY|nr:hypothetical protein F3Y22_tig00111648pilonHSYRG00284 [Hibiscus syriacus]
MQHVDSDNNSSDYEAIFQDDFTYIDSSSNIEEIMNSDSDEENKLLYLTKMGYSKAKASITMDICGLNSSIVELTDFICAAQMAKATDALLLIEDRKPLCNDPNYREKVHIETDQITQRILPKDAIEPHYFYYEKVALVPVGSAKLTERIRKALETSDDEPPSSVQKYVLDKDMFPGGINVLSLFSEISDAEVAFYCLGIPLKTDVQELNSDQLEQLMSRFGVFDLVVGSIQRNNLTGRNKHHQDELEDFR